MKLTIDTENKTITLLQAATFKELKSIRQFIGEDADEWQIISQVVKEQVSSFPNWWPWSLPYWNQPCLQPFTYTYGYIPPASTLTVTDIGQETIVSTKLEDPVGITTFFNH